MRRNRLRELLNAGTPTVGTHVFLSDPVVVEIVGHTGAFDYIEFLAEYSSYDLRGLEDFCRAAELSNLGSMIKIDFESHGYFAQRSVGAGFESVLFADARSPEDVRQFVAALAPDTPDSGGRFGVGARRHALPMYGGTPEYVAALQDVVVAIMIEKAPAVASLDAILEIEGIDLIQWGPSDYAMSIGKPGEESHQDVRDAELHVIETCLQAGIPCRAEIATVDDAERYLDLGVRHFSIGYDLFTIHDVFKASGERLRTIIT